MTKDVFNFARSWVRTGKMTAPRPIPKAVTNANARRKAAILEADTRPSPELIVCAFCGLGYDTAVRESCPHCCYIPAPTFVCAGCGKRYDKEPNEDDKDCPDCEYTNYYDK